MIKQEWIDELLSKVKIEQIIGEYVPLQTKGRRLWACCPFHNEKTPSFTVNAEDQYYKCFGCGKGGSAINFIMEMEKLSFPEACQFLADKTGMQMPEAGEDTGYKEQKEKREKIHLINEDAVAYFSRALYDDTGREALEYFTKTRKISSDAIKEFRLGYADGKWDSLFNYMTGKGYSAADLVMAGLCKKKDDRYYDVFRNRPIMPIVDHYNKVIGFGGRALSPDDVPKYLNTSETPAYNKKRNLYNLCNVKKIRDLPYIILAEGYMDVISLSSNGFKNSVATLGTALTSEQALLMSRYAKTVIISYDGDSSGIKAALRAVDILYEHGVEPRVLLIPDGLDPDEFIDKYGSNEYAKLLNKTYTRIGFKLHIEKEKVDMNTAGGREAFLKASVEILKTIDSAVELEKYVKLLSRTTGYSAEAIMQDVRGKMPEAEPAASAAPASPYSEQSFTSEKYLLSRMLESPKAFLVVSREYGINGTYFRNESYGRIFDAAARHEWEENKTDISGFLSELDNDADRFNATELFEMDSDEMVPGKEKDTFFTDCLDDIVKNHFESLRKALVKETVLKILKGKKRS